MDTILKTLGYKTQIEFDMYRVAYTKDFSRGSAYMSE